MHSSRMRTTHLLTISHSIQEGVSAKGVICLGGLLEVSAQGSLPRGVSPCEGGVSAKGGVCPEGCLSRGCLPRGCLPRGVSAIMGCVCPGGVAVQGGVCLGVCVSQ